MTTVEIARSNRSLDALASSIPRNGFACGSLFFAARCHRLFRRQTPKQFLKPRNGANQRRAVGLQFVGNALAGREL